MIPAARLQAAIEIVDDVIAAARSGGAAADVLIARYFKARRYAGSKDRRAVRGLAYDAIRRAGEMPASGRAALIGLAQDRPELAALFDGSAHAPAPIGADESGAPAGVAPEWLIRKLATVLSSEEMAALMTRAPLDLRVNRLKGTCADAMRLLPGAEPGHLSPDALRLPEGTMVETSAAFTGGLVEVQDEGSQLIVLACHARPGMTVIDLCAGARGNKGERAA
jgi:16S rRNA (cytosine967-C5)-methyltransferase